MMYCNNCFTAFDENEQDEPIKCSNCGEPEDIEPAFACEECGEYFPADELTSGFCKKCKNLILKKFRACMDTFTMQERELITDVYEGSYL